MHEGRNSAAVNLNIRYSYLRSPVNTVTCLVYHFLGFEVPGGRRGRGGREGHMRWSRNQDAPRALKCGDDHADEGIDLKREKENQVGAS